MPLLRGLTFPGVEYLFPLIFTSVACQAGNTIAALLGKVGLRKSPQAEEMWRSYESLVDPARRAAFVRTLRSVISLGGQQVSVHDRLHIGEYIPTLIVWGGHDSIIPIEHGRDADRVLPHSRFEVFEDAGHYPHCEAPERFVAWSPTSFGRPHQQSSTTSTTYPAGPGRVARGPLRPLLSAREALRTLDRSADIADAVLAQNTAPNVQRIAVRGAQNGISEGVGPCQGSGAETCCRGW